MTAVINRISQSENYNVLVAKMTTWQSDEALSVRRRVLPFAVGLRFSTQLIYSIRKILSNSTLTANWGTIIGDDGKTPSSECDIIIHETRSGSCPVIWNGDDPIPGGHVMDFRFVSKSAVKAVISCKTLISSINKGMRSDIAKLNPFTDRVWLFAECISVPNLRGLKSKIDPPPFEDMVDEYSKILKRNAMEAGYSRFDYLYAIRRRGSTDRPVTSEQNWRTFDEELRKLIEQEQE